MASDVADRLVDGGGEAVVLIGSHVRGDAYRESDIDLVAIGEGPPYRLQRHGERLVSIAWRTAKACQEDFRQPSRAGGVIPGWRKAVIIRDKTSIAAALKREAIEWTWEIISDRCDTWVPEELTGWAEEVHKLVGNLEHRRRMAAAVQRSLLAIHLASIIAVHHRILYDTENQLWKLVARKMGDRWARVQRRALGLEGESFEETCSAAVELFALAAAEVRDLFDDRQYGVVSHACNIAGRPLAEDHTPSS